MSLSAANPDFGRTAGDYATHRAGFPDAFFQACRDRGWVVPGEYAIDLGTGTGTVARGLAAQGLSVTGLDRSAALMAEAAALAVREGLAVDWVEGSAENTGQADAAFDLVTAGQCWHWFDPAKATAEIGRILRPGGRLIIAHFDWLPLPGNPIELTERMILELSPEWPFGGGTGFHPEWARHLGQAGFQAIESFSFDHGQPYTLDAWCGRIRASAPVSGSRTPEQVAAFDGAHRAALLQQFGAGPYILPHRVWAISAVSP